MPRAPEYDREHIVKEAMKVFWRKGYESTSMHNLIEAMEINRGSLYQAFGSKAGLFEEALKYYFDNFQVPVSKLVADVEPDIAIRSVFYAMFLIENPEHESWGCLLYNTVSELKHTKPEMAARAEQYLGQLSDLFEGWLDSAQQEDRMRRDHPASVYADYLITLCGGLRIAEKMAVPKSTLKTMIDIGIEPMLTKSQDTSDSERSSTEPPSVIPVDLGALNK